MEMKFVFYGLMVVGAYFLGKVMYPSLRPVMGLEQTEERETRQEVMVSTPLGKVNEVVDLENVAEEDFPEKIVIASEVTLLNEQGLDPLVLEVGSPVKPLKLDDFVLTVTSPLASHLRGEISVDETDFAKQVAMKRVARRTELAQAAEGKGPVAPQMKEEEPEEVAGLVETSEPEEASEPEVAMAEVAMAEPEVSAEPEEAEVAEEPALPEVLTAEQIVEEMKKSIQEGRIKEFAFDEVQEWSAGGDESFDGESYQVGLASYKAQTILGEKVLQAKALFQKGKLVKWVYGQTGMEIK